MLKLDIIQVQQISFQESRYVILICMYIWIMECGRYVRFGFRFCTMPFCLPHRSITIRTNKRTAPDRFGDIFLASSRTDIWKRVMMPEMENSFFCKKALCSFPWIICCGVPVFV